jgi:rhamnosyltransferase
MHILLGTYNGADYIAEQIQSIQKQSVTEWVLLIRDDGSTDDTVAIIRQITSGDTRIRIVDDNAGNLGVVRNFGRLMTLARDEDAEVIFFADQDDVWRPDKMELQLTRLRQMEGTSASSPPILVHSDLSVVDRNLQRLCESFMAYQGIANERRQPLKTLLVQNFVTGCATVVNRPLLELALPVPEGVLMHDWWLALCAAAFGEIGFVEEPTVSYRQHGRNEVGAKSFWGMLNPLRTNLLERWQIGERHFLGTTKQAAHLSSRMENSRFKPHPGAKTLSDGYAKCLSLARIRRLNWIRANGLRRQGTIRQILFLARLLLTARDN